MAFVSSSLMSFLSLVLMSASLLSAYLCPSGLFLIALFISSSSEDYNHLTEADITPLIKGFNVGNKTGTGLLFVVDAMSKPKKAVSVWVTLFDTKSKKILLTERVEGAVGMGFSFRNYWATGFKKVIDQIASKKYKEWSTK